MPAPWKGKSSDESAESGKKIKTDRIDLETCHFEVELRFHRADKKIEWKGTNVDVIQRFTVMFPILNHTAPTGTHHRPSQRHPITRSYHYHNQWIISSDLSSVFRWVTDWFALLSSPGDCRARQFSGWFEGSWWFSEYFTFLSCWNEWRTSCEDFMALERVNSFAEMLTIAFPSLPTSPSYTR